MRVRRLVLGFAVYGPFVALSVTLMQGESPPQHLAAMLAARSAVLLTASPLGMALGAVACVLLLARRRNQEHGHGQTDQESRSAGAEQHVG